MASLKKIEGVISHVENLSETAKEITFTLTEPLTFSPGSFVNLFVEHDGRVVRRAYSLSSSDLEPTSPKVAMRLLPGGELSSLFWERDMTGTSATLMGPLGLHTADKMTSTHAFLFGFGIGAGVVKSLADTLSRNPRITHLTIMTGSRTPEEVLFKEFYQSLSESHPSLSVTHVVSRADAGTGTPGEFRIGYIQDHISALDFSNADVYICGQTVACDALQKKILEKNPTHCTFFVEAFH